MSDPLGNAAAQMLRDGDPDYPKWLEVIEDAWGFIFGGALDAPEAIPAGSMVSDDSLARIGSKWPYKQSMARRGEEWVWTNCPYSGVRIRVPPEALKYIHE